MLNQGNISLWIERNSSILYCFEAGRERMNKKHIIKEGSRNHVINWFGEIQMDGTIKSREVCSEPNCEVNKEEEKE